MLLAANFVTSPRGVPFLREHHWATFDSTELANVVAAPARVRIGNPIEVLSGSTGVAGALALHLPGSPKGAGDGVRV